ncbi:MAG: SusC/RagA family TonB-linked outer membrane protein [Gemmatimonadetes bacterium]|nr:SusC/RagA family TonB-linked outer membrane protein [Gemmatimonadota bacterium]
MDIPIPFRRGASRSILAAALLLPASVAAQESGALAGTVREAGALRPLASVQVFLPELNRGALTGRSGAYRLEGLPPGSWTLRVESLGYAAATRTVEIVAGETARVDVELASSAIALDEIVVTGTGVATERRKLGNTVATIGARTLDEAPVSTLSEALQGRSPGVVGLPSGGLVGEGARIRIRGTGSLSQSNEPIVYIDGVRVDNGGGFSGGIGGGGGSPSRLDDINPAAIERIEILKGAAAATLYGTEASNGVIQIFTKKGSAGEPRWTLEMEQGLSRYPAGRYQPHAGFARTRARADSLSAFWGQEIRPWEVFEVDLVPTLFETGRSTTSTLSVGGGSDQVTYFVSGRLKNEDGPFTADGFVPDETGLERASDRARRAQLQASLSFVPAPDLQLRASSLYTESALTVPNNNNNIYGPTTSVIRSKPELANARNPTGDPVFTTVREVLHLFTEQDVRRFAGSLAAGWTPLAELRVDATAGVDVVGQQDTYFLPFGWNVDGVTRRDVLGSRTVSDRNHRQLTVDVKASWSRALSEAWTSSLVVGAQQVRGETRVLGGTGERFSGPGLEVAGAGAVQTLSESRLEEVSGGVFAQEQLGFEDWVFLTVGGRWDRHSAFADRAGGAFYPKASLSVVPGDLPGWDAPLGVSSLRLRAAVGRSGLQPGAFDRLTTFSPLASETGAGVAPSNLGNPDLRPEVSTEWELGAEVGLLHDRLGLDVTYWNRTVRDLLVDRQFAPSGGFRAPQLDNIGAMEAWGVEAGLTGTAVSRPGLSLDLFANASFLRERITDLGGAPPLKVGYFRYRIWLKEGYAPGAFFGPKLVDAANPTDVNRDGVADSDAELLAFLAEPRAPEEVRVLLADEDGDGDLLDHYLGKPTPDWQGSFGGTLSVSGGLRLSTLFEYRVGEVHVHNLTGAFQRSSPGSGRNVRRSAEVEATLLNPASTAEQRLDAARVWARELAALSPQDGLGEIEPADFLRLREVSLIWSLPARFVERLGAQSLELTLAGRDLALWTRYGGVDPELNAIGRGASGSELTNNFLSGVDAWGYALPRRLSVSATLGF